MPSSRDAPWRRRHYREEGTLKKKTVSSKPNSHPRSSSPWRGRKLESGDWWVVARLGSIFVWGVGFSRDERGRENRSMWVVSSPQNRQNAADWAAAGMSPTIMAACGLVWSTRRMKDLGEKRRRVWSVQILGEAKRVHPVEVYHENSRSSPSTPAVHRPPPSRHATGNGSQHLAHAQNIVSGVTGSMGAARESVPSRPLPCTVRAAEDPPSSAADGIPRLPGLPGYTRLTGALRGRARGCGPSGLWPARLLCSAATALARHTGGLKAVEHPILYEPVRTRLSSSNERLFPQPWFASVRLDPGSRVRVSTVDQIFKIAQADRELLIKACFAAAWHGSCSTRRPPLSPRECANWPLACYRTSLGLADRFLPHDQLAQYRLTSGSMF